MAAEFSGVLRRVVESLDTVGAPFVIVGSMAAATWGVVRSTRDVDLVTVVDALAAPQVVDSLADADLYVPTEAASVALATGGSFNVIDYTTGGKVDLFVVSPADEFERMRLDRRVRMSVLGVEAWVATPEDLILAKLRWRMSTRSEQQWRDCVEIASSNRLDTGHLRRWAAQLGIEHDLADLLTVVGVAGAD